MFAGTDIETVLNKVYSRTIPRRALVNSSQYLPRGGSRPLHALHDTFYCQNPYQAVFPDNFIVIYITELSFWYPLFYIRIMSC